MSAELHRMHLARGRRKPEVPKYSARLLRPDWSAALVPWLDSLRVPHRVVSLADSQLETRIPWDGEELLLSPACHLGPLWWIYCALHYAAALNDNRSPERLDKPGFGLGEEPEARVAVIEVRTKKAAMSLAVAAGATEDWLWRPALEWRMTKASLTDRPEDVMGRHIDQVRLKVPAWNRHFNEINVREPPILWSTVLLDA